MNFTLKMEVTICFVEDAQKLKEVFKNIIRLDFFPK